MSFQKIKKKFYKLQFYKHEIQYLLNYGWIDREFAINN